jgi:hypothetical protein
LAAAKGKPVTNFLQLRSANSGAPFVGENDLDTVLWDATARAWYVGPGGGGGSVSSVFGRAGAVVAATGDYDGDQVDNVSTVPGASLSDALDYLLANAGAVASVFGRTGVIVATAGDYDSDQVDNVSTVPGASLSDALDTLALSAGAVTSVFGRLGAVVSAANDYAASQVNNDSSVAGATVKLALQTLSGLISGLTTGVSSVFGRAGAVAAVAGDYTSTQVTNTSGVGGSTVSAALNTLASAISGLTTGVSSVFGRAGAVSAAADDYAASQVVNDSSTVSGAHVQNALDSLNAVSATARVLGRFAAGAGVKQEGTLSGGIEVNAGLTGIQQSTTLPVRGQENVAVDQWPTSQQQGALNTGGSVTLTVPVPAGKSIDIAARVQVDDSGTGAVVFFSRLLITAHNVAGVVSIILPTDCGTVPSSGISFTAAQVGTDIVFTLANSSGTNRTYNALAGVVSQDKP